MCFEYEMENQEIMTFFKKCGLLAFLVSWSNFSVVQTRLNIKMTLKGIEMYNYLVLPLFMSTPCQLDWLVFAQQLQHIFTDPLSPGFRKVCRIQLKLELGCIKLQILSSVTNQ